MTTVYDACIIGAGPAGITAALELAKHGLSVVLVESGADSFDKNVQCLSNARVITKDSHSLMDQAVQRGLGGTSAIWGGRCVPLDEYDFGDRDFIDCPGWPLTADELSAYYNRACEILGVGDADFEVTACGTLSTINRRLSSGFEDTETIRATQLERWCRQPNMWRAHKKNLVGNNHLTILSQFTCIGFRQNYLDGPVTEAIIEPTLAQQAETHVIKARVFIVACGGVESTRLVLNSMRHRSGLKLQSTELVGHYYMGHPSGWIADIELSGDPKETIYGFERDGDVFVRRRITFQSEILRNEKLLNIAFWLDNAPLADWRHGSGVLSAAYLALTAPLLGQLLAPAAIRKRVAGEQPVQRFCHVMNCIKNPLHTALFCIRFFYQRYLMTPRLPGFFTYSGTNRYALHYNGEQAPNRDSTITLSDEPDAHGLLRAQIALKWSQQDIDSIIRAHEVLDQALQKEGIGRLIYRVPREDFEQSIRVQAVDGFHQIGTLRMAADPAKGVTDSYGRMYGTSNLYIASSATFPTSGQANPTLALIALTIRQTRHIAAVIKNELDHA